MANNLSLSLVLRAVDKMSGPIKRVFGTFRRELLNAEKATAKFNQAMERATFLRVAADAVKQSGDKLLGAIRGPVSAAVALESAMADVRKVTNFTDEGLKDFTETLVGMSKHIPISAAGLAQIAAAGGQLGVAEKNLGKFVETAAKMAIAFDITPDEAGDSMAKLSNAFGIPIDNIEQLGDTINHLSNNSAAKAPEIVQALLRVGGTARQFGLAADQAAALTGAFVAMGRPPEVAATAVNALLSKLQTAEVQGGKFKSVLKHLGFSAKGFSQAIQNDANSALLSLFESINKLNATDQAKALSLMFGAEYQDDISLVVQNLGQYKKMLTLASDEQGRLNSMQHEFKSRSDTVGNGFVLLNNRMTAFKNQLGTALFPAIRDLTDWFGKAVDKLTVFAKEYPGLTKAVMVLAGAVGVLLSVLSPLLIALASLTVVAGGFGRGLLAIGRVVSVVKAPFKWIVGGMTRLAGLFTSATASAAGLVARFGGMRAALVSLGKALNPVLKLYAAFEGGKAIGTAIYNQMGSAAKNFVGESVARVAALAGNKEAKQALAVNQPAQSNVSGQIHVVVEDNRIKVKQIQSDSQDVDLSVSMYNGQNMGAL
jgi:TP901 family phage tail tape measure protein